MGIIFVVKSMNLQWHLIAVCITLLIAINSKYLLVEVDEEKEKPNFEDYSVDSQDYQDSGKLGLDYMYQNRYALNQQDQWTNDGTCCCFMDVSCYDCREGVEVSESEEKICEK